MLSWGLRSSGAGARALSFPGAQDRPPSWLGGRGGGVECTVTPVCSGKAGVAGLGVRASRRSKLGAKWLEDEAATTRARPRHTQPRQAQTHTAAPSPRTGAAPRPAARATQHGAPGLKISAGSHQIMFADLWFYEIKREKTRARENPGTCQHLEAGRMAGTVAWGLVHSMSATNLRHPVSRSQ